MKGITMSEILLPVPCIDIDDVIKIDDVTEPSDEGIRASNPFADHADLHWRRRGLWAVDSSSSAGTGGCDSGSCDA